jgi:hypothetical protein
MFLVFLDDGGGTVTAGPVQHTMLVSIHVVGTTGHLQCDLYVCRYIISVVVMTTISLKPPFYYVFSVFG